MSDEKEYGSIIFCKRYKSKRNHKNRKKLPGKSTQKPMNHPHRWAGFKETQESSMPANQPKI